MNDHYENGPEGMPRVKRMTDSTLGWVAAPITLLQLFQAHPGGREALNQFAHAVAEETLARIPAWPAVPQANAELDALLEAAKEVVRDALDNVAVHPCDQHNAAIRAKGLFGSMLKLYEAIRAASKTTPSSGEGGA